MLAILLPRNKRVSSGFWITLSIFAILFGVFLARTAAPYHRTGHVPQWRQAVWITPAVDSAIAYYRREWTMDSTPSRAYIQVSAPDSFTVYVNGIKVGNIEKPSTTAFDIMDVGSYLSAGKNVIAVRVERKTFPGKARLLSNLRWEDNTGLHQDLFSNDQWRVVRREERQNGGALPWYERAFDDSNWPQALQLKGSDTAVVHPAHPWISPELFQALPRGMWISSGHTTTGGDSFHRQFDLGSLGSGDIRSAWLGVASTAPYTLTINGAHGPTIGPGNQYMDTYDIGSFLFSGSNTIEINTSNFGDSGRLAVAGMISTHRELLDLSSNEDWRIRGHGEEHDLVTVLGKLESYPYIEEKTGRAFLAPTIRPAEIWLPGGLLLRHFVAAIPWIVGAFLITLLILVSRLSRASTISSEVVALSILPLKLASLVLCALYLLPFDTRISEAQIFNVPAVLVVATLTYALFHFIMTESEHGHH